MNDLSSTYDIDREYRSPMPIDHYVGSTIELNYRSRPRLRHETTTSLYIGAPPPNIESRTDLIVAIVHANVS